MESILASDPTQMLLRVGDLTFGKRKRDDSDAPADHSDLPHKKGRFMDSPEQNPTHGGSESVDTSIDPPTPPSKPSSPESAIDILDCGICLDDELDESIAYRLRECQHSFCRTCISEWVKFQGGATYARDDILPNCPKCRKILPPDEVQDLSRIIRSGQNKKDLHRCPYRPCRSKVVDLEGHVERMHRTLSECPNCHTFASKFEMRNHRRLACEERTTTCPLPRCPAVIEHHLSSAFIQRYWAADPNLARDLINHHQCVAVSMCILCEPYSYFLTHELLHAHFLEAHK